MKTLNTTTKWLGWNGHDVLTHEPLNPDGTEMTLEQAEAWMDSNWKHIRDRLCELGNGMIGDLLWNGEL